MSYNFYTVSIFTCVITSKPPLECTSSSFFSFQLFSSYSTLFFPVNSIYMHTYCYSPQQHQLCLFSQVVPLAKKLMQYPTLRRERTQGTTHNFSLNVIKYMKPVCSYFQACTAIHRLNSRCECNL